MSPLYLGLGLVENALWLIPIMIRFKEVLYYTFKYPNVDPHINLLNMDLLHVYFILAVNYIS